MEDERAKGSKAKTGSVFFFFFLKGWDVDCVDSITNVQNNDNVCTALNITKQSCQLNKINKQLICD